MENKIVALFLVCSRDYRTMTSGGARDTASFHGSSPNFSFNEIAGFNTSSRSYLLKYGVPRHPDVVDR